MAPSPQHKQQFESFLNAPGAHALIDYAEPLFMHGLSTDEPGVRRVDYGQESQQILWQYGETLYNAEHDRLCMTLGQEALTIAISHRHEESERATLVIDHWRPSLYIQRGHMPAIEPSLEGEEATRYFMPLFEHSVAVFGLSRYAADYRYADAS